MSMLFNWVASNLEYAIPQKLFLSNIHFSARRGSRDPRTYNFYRE